jgi:hypothetical protein
MAEKQKTNRVPRSRYGTSLAETYFEIPGKMGPSPAGRADARRTRLFATALARFRRR